MKDKLELISIAKKFNVIKNADGDYEIEYAGLGSIIDKNGTISYFVTGCYNSGLDWLDIDIKNLEELKKFCELLVGDDKNA